MHLSVITAQRNTNSSIKTIFCTFRRERFQREASVLSEIRDPNVAQVIGACSDTDPMCMVLEYTRHGDLKNFLQSHVPEDAATSGTRKRILRYNISSATITN